MSTLESELSTAESAVSSAQGAVSTAQSSLATAQSSLSAAQYELSAAQAIPAEIIVNEDGTQTEDTSARDAAVSAAQAKVSAAEAEVNAAQNELNNAQTQLTDAQGKVQEIQGKISNVDSQIQNIVSNKNQAPWNFAMEYALLEQQVQNQKEEEKNDEESDEVNKEVTNEVNYEEYDEEKYKDYQVLDKEEQIKCLKDAGLYNENSDYKVQIVSRNSDGDAEYNFFKENEDGTKESIKVIANPNSDESPKIVHTIMNEYAEEESSKVYDLDELEKKKYESEEWESVEATKDKTYKTGDGSTIEVSNDGAQVKQNKNTGEIVIIGAQDAKICPKGGASSVNIIDSSVESIVLDTGSDNIFIKNSTVDEIVDNSGGNNNIEIRDGSTVNNIFLGNESNDEIIVSDSTVEYLNSGSGDDTIQSIDSSNIGQLYGGHGNDNIFVYNSNVESLYSTDYTFQDGGADKIYVKNSKVNDIHTGSGADDVTISNSIITGNLHETDDDRINIKEGFFSDKINYGNKYNTEQGEPASQQVSNYDEDGNEIGYSQAEEQYNADGNLLTSVAQNYDMEGNLIGSTSITNVYDENGVLREQISITYDKHGNETFNVSQKLDTNGNVTQEYLRATASDGSIEEKLVNLLYEDTNNPNVSTFMQEHVVEKDANGNTTLEKRTNTDLLTVLKQNHPDNKNIQDAETVQDALATGGIAINTDELYTLMKSNLTVVEGQVIALGEDMINSIKLELEAKLSLMAEGNIFEENKDDLQKELNEAVDSGNVNKIKEIYEKINLTLYPNGSYNPFSSEIMKIESAEKYYNEMGSETVKENFAIRDGFDYNTMIPETYGEILLYQMNDLKKQYELYKENMGSFDKIVSYCNVFGFGTSEDEVRQMFELYEEEVKNLSTLEGKDFISSFKALTGDDFSQETFDKLLVNQLFSSSVDKMTEEQLLAEANEQGINIEEAYVYDYQKSVYEYLYDDEMYWDPTYIASVSEICKTPRIDYDHLRILLKASYAEAANNSTIGKAVDDYADTVVEHREFIIDLARTALVALTSATGGGIVICGFVGAGVEMISGILNSDAQGTQKQSGGEIIANMTSGFISAAFQGGSRQMMNLTLPGTDCSLNSLISNATQNLSSETLKNLIPKYVELIGVKGVTAGVIQNTTNFLMKNYDFVKKLLKGEEITEDEINNFKDGLINAVNDGTINGAITGVLLSLFESVNVTVGKKLRDAVHKNSSQAIQGEINTVYSSVIKTLVYTPDKLANATGKTASRTIAKILQGEEVDFDTIMETEFKEIAKNAFK